MLPKQSEPLSDRWSWKLDTKSGLACSGSTTNVTVLAPAAAPRQYLGALGQDKWILFSWRFAPRATGNPPWSLLGRIQKEVYATVKLEYICRNATTGPLAVNKRF